MNCPKCGYALPDDSAFCQYCGTKMVAEKGNPVLADALIVELTNLNHTQEKDQEPQNHIESVSPVKACETAGGADIQNNCGDPIPDALDGTTDQSKVPTHRGKKKYCKFCGGLIDEETRKCSSCGKQFFKLRFKFFFVIFFLFALLCGYIATNYFCAVSAMNNQKYIKSQQFFDNLLVSKTVFPEKYAYVEAGVLIEEGKYIDALKAFKKIDNIPIPKTITNSLESEIYSAGQTAYKAGNMAEAEKNFSAINSYKRSSDYLLLIRCSEKSYPNEIAARIDYSKLVKLLGFENTDEIILKTQPMALLFLAGRWEDGNINPTYFEIYEDDDGTHSQYNLPHKDAKGFFEISNAIYSVWETEPFAIAKLYKFSIIDEDTIFVYCYKDGSRYKLFRQ